MSTSPASANQETGKSPAPEHFILFRRLSCKPGDLGELIASVESASGIPRSDLRYRLAGAGLGVLIPKKSRPEIEDCAAEMTELGLPATVLERAWLAGAKLPPQARRVHIEKGMIEFQSAEEKPLLRVGRETRLLAVVTDITGNAVKQILSAIAYTGQSPEAPFEEAMKKIVMGRPVALLYDLAADPVRGVFIDAGAFVFLGLDERLTASGSLNFRIMIDEAIHLSGHAATDHYFGISALPGAKPDWKGSRSMLLRRLAIYSRYLTEAGRKGFFEEKPSTPLPFGSIHENAGSGSDSAGSPDEPPPDTLQPPPPVEQGLFGGTLHGSWSEVSGVAAGLAAILLYATTDFSSLSALAGSRAGLFKVCLGVLTAAFGAVFFSYSLLLLYYKRMVENTPTSRVRSLSMGVTELAGKVRPYYDLRTSYTLTRCIFYICRYYKYQRSGESSNWHLTRRVSSGKIPFYLEDSTGRVLVDPKGALYTIGRVRQSLRGRFIPSLAIKLDDPNTKVIEDLIPIGARIYVLGSAHVRRTGKRHQERLIDRLRRLKSNASEMARYDRNGDGHIDAEEWDAARSDIETRMYAESLATDGTPDEMVVVEKPKFGLLPFIIADSEEKLLGRLALRTWLFLVIGVLAFACGVGMIF
jgi:hypothetical protein